MQHGVGYRNVGEVWIGHIATLDVGAYSLVPQIAYNRRHRLTDRGAGFSLNRALFRKKCGTPNIFRVLKLTPSLYDDVTIRMTRANFCVSIGAFIAVSTLEFEQGGQPGRHIKWLSSSYYYSSDFQQNLLPYCWGRLLWGPLFG